MQKQIEQTLDSREVAEMVGKDHKNLMRDIRSYVVEMNELKIEPVEFFRENTYKDSKGEERPCYSVTKKGCEFIAHKLTGIKGTEFTAKYINRFHKMEDELQQPKSPMQLLELEFAAIKEVDSKVEAVNADLQNFKRNLPLLPAEAEHVVNRVNKRVVAALGGKNSNAYNDTSLRSKVYSDIHRELKRQFGVTKYKYIKSCRCEAALEIIDEYELPIVLQDMIVDANAQINIENYKMTKEKEQTQ